MSEPFKPGDVVQSKSKRQVVKAIEQHRFGGVLVFESGDWGGVENYELVDPSVPVSKIREVLTEAKHGESARTRLILSRLCEQLTGERP